MKRRIGLHVSISGGLDKGLLRAAELGCSTVQLFSHNPRGWALGSRNSEEIIRFRTLRVELDLSPIFIHTSYLINLASARDDLLMKSIDMIAAELDIADEIGAEYVILHTGSASGDAPASARRRAEAALRQVADRGSWTAGLLLENTAGERGDITSHISEIGEVMDGVPSGLIAGICLDTCHAFAAGYDISSDEGVASLAHEITRYVGRDKLKLIHLNDSKKKIGSGVDRHEHIGEGMIGESGLRNFLRDKFFIDIPLILETPKKFEDDDAKNLSRLQGMLP